MPILRVALDLPLHRLFDYVAESASPADVGRLVRVPFAKGERIGLIAGIGDDSAWPAGQLKAVSEVLRDRPLLPRDFLDQIVRVPAGLALVAIAFGLAAVMTLD